MLKQQLDPEKHWKKHLGELDVVITAQEEEIAALKRHVAEL